MILKEMLNERNDVYTLTPDARVYEAAELMREKHVGSIVVVEDGFVIGIITDRDIALSLALGAATPQSYISEIMSTDVATVTESMTLMDVTRCFRAAQKKRLPIVDHQNKLLGLISTDDLMSLLSREMFETCDSLRDRVGHLVS